MMLQIDLWQLLGALGSLTVVIIGAMWVLVKSNVSQYDRRLTEKFAAHEKTESEGIERLNNRVGALEVADKEVGERLASLEAREADMTPVWERISEMADSLAHLEGEFKGANDLLKIIHARLMNQL